MRKALLYIHSIPERQRGQVLSAQSGQLLGGPQF